jgi:catechol 2,3-dioxygenase-like lactoylglutathione lyase family enzyme
MKALILALFLATASSVETHAKDRAAPFKPVTGAFFALSVPNMAESVRWYSEKFGLAVTFEAHGPVEVTVLEGAGLLVELIRDPAAQPRPSRPDLLHGPFKAGFLVKDFDSAVKELGDRGVEIAFGPFPARDGQRANIVFRDNSGNLIQVFGD